MKIYLAGKIEPGGWQESLVNKKALYLDRDYIDAQVKNDDWELPIREKAIFNRFDYVGPFLLEEKPEDPPYIKDYNTVNLIELCDLVFAYFPEKKDCQLAFDIGYAAGIHKKIWIAISNASFLSVHPTTLANIADRIHTGCNDLPSSFQWMLQQEGLFCDSPIEEAFFLAARHTRLNLIPQHSVGQYRADFAIPQIKLAIELDGHDFHKTKEQRTHDARRDRFFIEQGWHVVRFTGSEIYRDVQKCINQVKNIAKSLS